MKNFITDTIALLCIVIMIVAFLYIGAALQ